MDHGSSEMKSATKPHNTGRDANNRARLCTVSGTAHMKKHRGADIRNREPRQGVVLTASTRSTVKGSFTRRHRSVKKRRQRMRSTRDKGKINHRLLIDREVTHRTASRARSLTTKEPAELTSPSRILSYEDAKEATRVFL